MESSSGPAIVYVTKTRSSKIVANMYTVPFVNGKIRLLDLYKELNLDPATQRLSTRIDEKTWVNIRLDDNACVKHVTGIWKQAAMEGLPIVVCVTRSSKVREPKPVLPVQKPELKCSLDQFPVWKSVLLAVFCAMIGLKYCIVSIILSLGFMTYTNRKMVNGWIARILTDYLEDKEKEQVEKEKEKKDVKSPKVEHDPDFVKNVKILLNMGFTQEESTDALIKTENNYYEAIAMLLK